MHYAISMKHGKVRTLELEVKTIWSPNQTEHKITIEEIKILNKLVASSFLMQYQ